MVMCATDRMGFGDDELGLRLLVNFLCTLKDSRYSKFSESCDMI